MRHDAGSWVLICHVGLCRTNSGSYLLRCCRGSRPVRRANAEDRDLALQAIKTFTQLYGAKFPKAVKKITDDEAELLAFYDFPAEHWIHLRTTNPIESTFACAPRSPAAPAPAPPPWRWSSSSSSPPRPGGGP